MPLPTPQQLRYLVALHELKHFGRAAESCGVAQSVLAAELLALERQMDARLLDREGGRLIDFTSLGHDMAHRARAALASLEAMVGSADEARAPMSGRLRFGVIPTIAPFLLPRVMPALRRQFPDLRLMLREDVTRRLVSDLANRGVDLVLLALPSRCPDAEVMSVMEDELVAALPPGHRLAASQCVAASALADETLLLLDEGHCLRDQALQACGVHRGGQAIDQPPDFTATSLHTLVQMVAGGLGVTLLPRVAVEAGITNGTGIELRRLAGGRASRVLGLAWRPGSPRAAEFRALGRTLTEAAAPPAKAAA